MDYNSMLKIVQKQNPDLSFKEQQAKASDSYKAFKKAQTDNKTTSSLGVRPAMKPEALSAIAKAEKEIRSKVIDVNSILTLGRQVIPAGKLERHGKEGVNTLVTFEDESGNRLPISGYFRIYI